MTRRNAYNAKEFLWLSYHASRRRFRTVATLDRPGRGTRARTSRGSYPPTTGGPSATASCARSPAASPRFLRERGLGPNDRVALLSNNSIEHLLCYFGVMAAGATICTIHVEMNRNQLDNIFARLKPKLVLYQDGLQLDDLLAGVAAPRLRLGRWDKPEPGTPVRRTRALHAERGVHGAARRRCRDPLHIRHQRSAQGRGAEFSRALVEYRSDGRGLRHHGRRPRL